MTNPRFFPSNPHAQTVLRSWLPERPSPLLVRRTLILPDGDLLDLDVLEPADDSIHGDVDVLKPARDAIHGERAADSHSPSVRAKTPGQPGPLSGRVVILVHGLEGSSRRPYVQSMVNEVVAQGGVAVAMNFRGCGGSENRSRVSYHAGWIQDLEEVVRWTTQAFPGHAAALVGFSLGAAITLHFLARSPLSDRIGAAAAVSPPLDMRRIALHLQHGTARAYERYFLTSLAEKTRAKQALFPDYPAFTGRTLYDFDDQVTAPVHGFASADDYYAQCSGSRFLPDLKAPTLVVHSLDDPICVLSGEASEQLARHPMVRPCITPRGGHVAFMTYPAGWLRRTMAGFLSGTTGLPASTG